MGRMQPLLYGSGSRMGTAQYRLTTVRNNSKPPADTHIARPASCQSSQTPGRLSMNADSSCAITAASLPRM